MFSLTKNLWGQDFVDLISACFDCADVFSLSQNVWFNVEPERSVHLLQRLSPYHLRYLETNHWFCYYTPEDRPRKVHLFQITPETRSIVLSAFKKLFFDDKAWEEPEDICFFRNNRLILGSVSHEQMCYLYDLDLWQLLRAKNFWECVPDEEAERIILPQ